METTLTVRNVVLIGEFKVSNFDKYYFIKNQIFSEEEISKTHFSNDLSHIETNKFHLVIYSNQMILTALYPHDNDDLFDILNRMIDTGSCNCDALGINYHYYIFSEGKTDELSKKFFDLNNRFTNEIFNAENVSYGYYVSKDIGSARLKLDIKPSNVRRVDTDIENKVLAFIFNFHIDLKAHDVKESILEAPMYKSECDKIMKYYEID